MGYVSHMYHICITCRYNNRYNNRYSFKNETKLAGWTMKEKKEGNSFPTFKEVWIPWRDSESYQIYLSKRSSSYSYEDKNQSTFGHEKEEKIHELREILTYIVRVYFEIRRQLKEEYETRGLEE